MRIGSSKRKMKVAHAARAAFWAAGASVMALCAAVPAHAQDQYWDGPNVTPGGVSGGRGGGGDWTDGTTNWTNAAGTANSAWQDDSNAIFQAPTANPVRVIGNHRVRSLKFYSDYQLYADTFQVANGALVSATGQLSIAGDTEFYVADGVSARITLPVTGTGGMVRSGSGTLYLEGPNFFTGNARLLSGTTVVAGSAGLNGLGVFTANRSVTISGDALLRFQDATGIAGSVNYYNDAVAPGTGIEFRANASVNGAAIYSRGYVTFFDQSRGNGGSITNNAGGVLEFRDSANPGTMRVDNHGTLLIGNIAGPGITFSNLYSTTPVDLAGKRLIIRDASANGSAIDAIFSQGILDSGPVGGNGQNQQAGGNPGWLEVNGAQTYVMLMGDSSYMGGTYVDHGGSLQLNGTVLGDVNVYAGALIYSGGDIAGALNVDGPEARIVSATGSDPNDRANKSLFTLTMQSLAIVNDATLEVHLTQPYAPAAQNAIGPLDVRGNVVLAGSLDVVGEVGFGNGLYRLISYGGTLSGAGLTIDVTPPDYRRADFTVQTAIPGQINLIVNRQQANIVLQFWDGDAVSNMSNLIVDGGNGVWSAARPNWTNPDGTINARMTPQPGFAIFAGAPGTVTVSLADGPIVVEGMQFATSGYLINGEAIALSAAAFAVAGQHPKFRVGDGTAAGAGYVATIAAPLIGDGGLEKIDLGTLILTGNSSYSGPTRVMEGALVVNGTITSSVTVASGAFLRGNGRVGATQLLAGATIAPGNSIGTLSVSGAISFAAGTVYQVEASPAAADRISASGAATLAGGTVIVTAAPGDYGGGRRYTILSAGGGLNGRFARLTTNLPYLAGRLDYDAGNAYLVLALDNRFSGEIHNSMRAVLVDDSRFVREAALDRLHDAGTGGGAWLRGVGAWGNWDASGVAGRVSRDLGGVLGGVDMTLGPVRVGVVGGYTHVDARIGAVQSQGDADNSHIGAYAGGRLGPVGLRAGVAYSWHVITTDRVVSANGTADAPHGRYRGRTTQMFGELDWAVEMGPVTLTPHAMIAHVRLTTDAAGERGGTAALRIDGARMTTNFSTLGLSGAVNAGGLTISADGGWRHAFDRLGTPGRIAFGDGSRFDTAGVPIAPDALAAKAAVELNLGDRITASLRYSGQIARAARDHSVNLGVVMRF